MAPGARRAARSARTRRWCSTSNCSPFPDRHRPAQGAAMPRQMTRTPFLVVSALSVALVLGACKPDGDATADQGTAAADPAAGTSLEIEGLPSEKAQASYMVGMDIAESLQQVEDEVDVDVVIDAIRETLGDGTPKLNDAQR